MPDGSSRSSPLELDAQQFRAIGHAVVDDVAALLASLESPAQRLVLQPESLEETQQALGTARLPHAGAPPDVLLREARELLFEHAPLTGHPRFWGYICGAPAPIGTLAEILATAVNPNVGGWQLSRIATEIERQTVRWIAELIGYPSDCGGLLVSGGNMANFVAMLAARRAGIPWDVRVEGIGAGSEAPRIYCSAETHTWVQKAADMFGLGTRSVRWIETDDELRMRVDLLSEAIASDRRAGDMPLLVVATAGSVSTGAIDPLVAIAETARHHGLWLHVDGAYGGVAACLADAPADLKALALADSVAVDPHKWLYAPLEAGCVLVRREQTLLDAFSYRPSYYQLDEGLNYFEYGPQNSRCFRALKIWLALRQAGRNGYEQMIGDDIRLAKRLYALADDDSELEARTTSLSITTFRYVPRGVDSPTGGDYLDDLNQELLARLNATGEAFLSNAVVDGRFYLRACIVNFRTTGDDVAALPGIVKRVGAELHAERHSKTLR
jgi:aromatic-L-amino-acid/L-tryptophan decarboxylase